MADRPDFRCACGVTAWVPDPYRYAMCMECQRIYYLHPGKRWELTDGELPWRAKLAHVQRRKPYRPSPTVKPPDRFRITRNGIEQERSAWEKWLECRSCALVKIGYVAFERQSDGTLQYVHTDGSVWCIAPLSTTEDHASPV